MQGARKVSIGMISRKAKVVSVYLLPALRDGYFIRNKDTLEPDV